MARPVETYYDKNLIKTANERLRKIEKVYNMQNLSAEYRLIERYAIEQPNGKGKIYRITPEGGIRFINKTDYENLSQADKRYFNQTLENFLNSQTSTKLGIEKSYHDAYETFIENHPQYENMSFDDYMDTWKTYHDKIAPDKENHFSYSRIQLLINNGAFNNDSLEALSVDQIEQSNHYMNNISGELTANRGHKFNLHYTNPNRPSMADSAPTRPDILNSSAKGVKYRGINGKGK